MHKGTQFNMIFFFFQLRSKPWIDLSLISTVIFLHWANPFKMGLTLNTKFINPWALIFSSCWSPSQALQVHQHSQLPTINTDPTRFSQLWVIKTIDIEKCDIGKPTLGPRNRPYGIPLNLSEWWSWRDKNRKEIRTKSWWLRYS